MVEIDNVKRKNLPKNVPISLRTDKETSKWMKDNKISPQLVFDEAIEELKEKNK